MFGLSLPTVPFLPFLSGRSSSVGNEPLVLDHDSVEEIGRELDALREQTLASLGDEDREYLYRIIRRSADSRSPVAVCSSSDSSRPHGSPVSRR